MPRDRESRISATKPIFPEFLLPSLKFPFRRRQPGSVSSESDASCSSTPMTSPSSSPVETSEHQRLARLTPDTLRCITCSSDLAFTTQIISKGFTGRYGRALLVAPPPTAGEESLMNIRVGRSENRQLVTGWHVVADITCATCCKKLGWKYVDAKESSQHYKIGKFILETKRVISHRSWGDAPLDGCRDGQDLAEIEDIKDDDQISFDSENEDECEDLFAGVWDAESVAKRRNRLVIQMPGDLQV